MKLTSLGATEHAWQARNPIDRAGQPRYLESAQRTTAAGDSVFNLNLKEFIMNEATHQDASLEVVDLGDAKELTMGVFAPVYAEENPQIQGKD